MKKIKLLGAVINFLNLQNFAVISKRMFFVNESPLKKLRKIAWKRDLSILSSYSGQKDLINYITSRHMRKTILPSDFKNIMTQSEMNVVNVKYIVHVISHKLKKTKEMFYTSSSMNTSNFHTRSCHRSNLISKESKGSEALPSENEAEQWGGLEAFRCIKFVKDNLDESINANPFALVFYYAYWCRHCSRLKSPYGKVALMAKQEDLKIAFLAFDVSIDPDAADEKGVVGVPIIKYYYKGKFISVYKGKRTVEDLYEFVKNPPTPVEHKQPDI